MEGYVLVDDYRVLWITRGKPHRTRGPAVVTVRSVKWWYLNGKKLTKKEFNKRVKAWKGV